MRKANSAGYTLIEVMLASAILGFGLLGLYALQNTSTAYGGLSAKMTTCRMLAQQQMEYLQGLPWGPDDSLPTDLTVTASDPTTASKPLAFLAHPTGTAGVAPSPITGIGTSSVSDGPRSYYRTWDVSYPFTGDSHILQIKVRCIFYDSMGGKPHGVTISSFRYQDPS